jgi:hypothetical protein
MSGYVDDSEQCEVIRGDLAELALGILSGRRRSEVLGHVGTCGVCRAGLESHSTVADTLLHFAPASEPPVGFEVRIAERLRAGANARRPRRVRRGMWVG